MAYTPKTIHSGDRSGGYSTKNAQDLATVLEAMDTSLAAAGDVTQTSGALTDSSGGSAADQTLAIMTNVDTLTDSTGGSADDTVADCSTAVTGVDGTGSNAASKADVDTRLGTINDNFKELTDQIITQEAFNTVTANSIAKLAEEVNALIVDVAAIIAAVA